MKPTPGMKKTILLGKCMVQANKDHPDIREMIPVKGCPPSREELVRALQRAGVEVNEKFFVDIDLAPGFYLKRYAGRPEFEEAFFRISG
jgi:coenzyme F420-reducing hydrogenase gamma subunit